jgi:hypothetical protein
MERDIETDDARSRTYLLENGLTDVVGIKRIDVSDHLVKGTIASTLVDPRGDMALSTILSCEEQQ